MSIKVKIPSPLQRLTNGQEEVEGEPGTIIGLVNYLDKKYSGIGEKLIVKGELNRWVNFYVNDEDMRFLDYGNTKIKDGDQVSIVPAIAGGLGKYLINNSRKV